MDGLCLFSLMVQGIGKRPTRPPNHTKPTLLVFIIRFLILFVLFYKVRKVINILRKVVGKNVHATIPIGYMGYVQYNVPDTVAVEPTFVALL